MSNNIVQFNEEIIKGQIKKLFRGSVEGSAGSERIRDYPKICVNLRCGVE